jgi:hypothetical protein
MAQPSGRRQGRTRRTAPRRSTQPQPATRDGAVRERLRRDPFLFILCLSGLAFVSWAGAMTWWVTGATAPLAVALASVAPAFYLFYLRDA